MVAARKIGKVKKPREGPLAKDGIVLRDFKVGNHTFKKGTRDSWNQVKLTGTTERMLNVVGVYLKHSFNAEEDAKKLEEDRQKEADRQLEQLAAKLEREKVEETRKRMERVAKRKAALAEQGVK